MDRSREHAVVLGGSIGGLLAARALADQFDRVTVIERDALPTQPAHRKGTPQARHTHALLCAGWRVLDRRFPGILDELFAAGAETADATARAIWHDRGHRLCAAPSGDDLLLASRLLVETVVRRRTLALPGVELIDSCDALGLIAEGDRVVGVRTLARRDGASEQALATDLVVDATGRGSRAPAWLAALGFPAAVEERVSVDIHYVTALFRRAPDHAGGAPVILCAPTPAQPRGGVALWVEGGLWTVTMIGYGEYGPRADSAHAMRAFAATLPVPELAAIMTEPVGAPQHATYSESRRRRYERSRHLPRGFVAFGDSLCSFNPIYGQGMSAAALQSDALADAVDGDDRTLPRRFYARAARILDTPWQLAVGSDRRYPQANVRRRRSERALDWYLDRLLAAARTDPVVRVAYSRVGQLLAAPGSLMTPGMLWRVLQSRRDELGAG